MANEAEDFDLEEEYEEEGDYDDEGEDDEQIVDGVHLKKTLGSTHNCSPV